MTMLLKIQICDACFFCPIWPSVAVNIHNFLVHAIIDGLGGCYRRVSPRHYTVNPMLSASGNLFECHEEVLYLQPLIPPKRFDIFSP